MSGRPVTVGVTAVFAELARLWDERSDAVDVGLDVVDDRPLPALLRAAEHAGLLVVGSRPHPARPVRRSTVAELVRSARCPVLVHPVADGPGDRSGEVHAAGGTTVPRAR
ncbi:universal stress protein [Pseudonocardia spirodelae]|uniref:Universal stress protein n=1 Tax=Pseudonocardia spirodelae TaxID=3133431 RepID=A0ABU8T2I5_9PSEU